MVFWDMDYTGQRVARRFSRPLLSGSHLIPGEPGQLRFDLPVLGATVLTVSEEDANLRPALAVSYFTEVRFGDDAFSHQMHAEIAGFSRATLDGTAGRFSVTAPPVTEDPTVSFYRGTASAGAFIYGKS